MAWLIQWQPISCFAEKFFVFFFLVIFRNLDCCGKHCCFYLDFSFPKRQNKNFKLFFCLNLKNVTRDSFCDGNIVAIKNEAILSCEYFDWNSFMCLLELPSVLKDQFCHIFQLLVMLIISIYLIVISLQEWTILSKSASTIL